jgi:hypothetical protein
MGDGPVGTDLSQQIIGVCKPGQSLGTGEIGYFQAFEPGQD